MRRLLNSNCRVTESTSSYDATAFLPRVSLLSLLGWTLALHGHMTLAQSTNPAAVDARTVSFQASDGGQVFADLYGDGDHGVVLAHGAIFNKESWTKQADVLRSKGLRVLAIDFRGYGKSQPGTDANALYLDVAAAVKYLREQGVRRVSVVGGSMGGAASAVAAAKVQEGEIDRLILLAAPPIGRPQDMRGNKLFVVSQGDRLLRSVKQQYEAAPQPKKLVVLDGRAHAQHIFKTDQSDRLMDLIVNWLLQSDAQE